VIRDLYRRSTPYGRATRYPDGGDGSGLAAGVPLPERATRELPGTEAKILVLMERARLRQQLWHQADARADEEGEIAAPWLRIIKGRRRHPDPA
jgi:hypothetical protein